MRLQRRGVVVCLLVVCVTVLIGFAPTSRVVATVLPIAPVLAEPLANPFDLKAPRVAIRDLPVGLPSSGRAVRPNDLSEIAVKALGVRGAQALVGVLASEESWTTSLTKNAAGPYPSRYPAIERLLDHAPARATTLAAASLGAELISFAAVHHRGGNSNSVSENVGPVAYALLLRARIAAGCEAELNLLLLLAADSQPHDDIVRQQADKAMESCPGDPTPGWLLAQFQSQRALVSQKGLLESMSGEAVGEEPPADRIQRAALTLTTLERSFPGSAGVWTAEGDMRLRLAKEYLPAQPFSSRRTYEMALAAYDRAERLGSGLPATVGRARALIGLGRPSEAADLLSDPERTQTFRGPVLNLQIEALEEARRFAEARHAAEELISVGAAGYPTIGPVFPGEEALSTGVDTTVPLRVALAPEEGGAGGGDADDISFIPAFRVEPGLTGSLNHCAEWSRRRDAILAGQAADMLTAQPLTIFPDVRGTDGTCWMADPALLANITRREARDRTLNLGQDDLSAIDDARQNVWRWAGDLDRAIAVISEWDTATDRQLFLPAFRLAEIQFLQRRFDDSAATFGIAERRAESGHFITLDSARARLGRGAALVASGRFEEGIAILNELDDESRAS